MTSESPGPGYWMASDGKWYPPKWEYTSIRWFSRDASAVMSWAEERADQLGKQGWEMVSHTSQGMPAQGGFGTEVTAFFKRRITN
jgi:hypothetical protein